MDRPRFEPYLEQPRAEFRWRLGIRPLELREWFIFDEHAEVELRQKFELTQSHWSSVYASMDGVDDEVDEVVAAINNHLTTHHPERTRASDPALPPLAAVGLNLQEDLVLMVRRKNSLVFGAGSVCFPNRWDLKSKIGRTMRAVHEPVPDLNNQLGTAIDDFLDRLTPDKPVWRLGWGVIDTDDLYQPTDGTAPARPKNPQPDGHYLRVERETIRVFPQTGCVLFTIRTFMSPLDLISDNKTSAQALATSIDSMPTEIARYKQLDRSGPEIAKWLRG